MGENIGNACGIWDPIKNQNKMKVQKSTKELLKHVNCLKKSFQHPVEKGKTTMNVQQAWHNPVLQEIVKNRVDNLLAKENQ